MSTTLGIAPRSCFSCGDPTHRVGEDACFYKETALQPQACSACHMGGHLRQHCCGPNQRAIQALKMMSGSKPPQPEAEPNHNPEVVGEPRHEELDAVTVEGVALLVVKSTR